MSPPSSKKKGAAERPTADIYVGMLIVGLGALLTGIIFLALELNKYGWAGPSGV